MMLIDEITPDYLKHGSPAFPGKSTDKQHYEVVMPRMTLRQWYAGQALTGWLCGYESFCDVGTKQRVDIADTCFELADAMLAHERDEKKTAIQICQQCGDEYINLKPRGVKRKYCSDSCKSKAYRERKEPTP